MAAANASSERSYHHGSLRESLLARAAEVIDEFGLEALTLRGLARDLGVSHGAPNRHFRSREELISRLAAEAWTRASEATLTQAEDVGDDPWVRLNAMGRGYLGWALRNRALFATATHPDVMRYADDELRASMAAFQQVIRDAVVATQAHGRHANVQPAILTLYTNAVPFGAAMLMANPVLIDEAADQNIDELVADVIELVVPIKQHTPVKAV